MRFPEPGASGRAAARGALLLAALVLWLPAAAQAQAPADRILVRNTGQDFERLVSFGMGAVAQGFRTGMNPAGYVLSTLEVILQTEENAMISEHTVTLRNASGGNPGSMLLATFVNPSSPTLGETQQTFKFTLSEGVELDPDTPYFIHWVHNHATERVKVAVTVSDNQDSGGLTDWGIDDVATVTTNLTSSGWINMAASQAIQMRLNGYAKTPAPVLSTAEVDGDELVLTYGEALDGDVGAGGGGVHCDGGRDGGVGEHGGGVGDGGDAAAGAGGDGGADGAAGLRGAVVEPAAERVRQRRGRPGRAGGGEPDAYGAGAGREDSGQKHRSNPRSKNFS